MVWWDSYFNTIMQINIQHQPIRFCMLFKCSASPASFHFHTKSFPFQKKIPTDVQNVQYFTFTYADREKHVKFKENRNNKSWYHALLIDCLETFIIIFA